MACLPGALASTLSRHLLVSNSRLETLVVIIMGLRAAVEKSATVAAG